MQELLQQKGTDMSLGIVEDGVFYVAAARIEGRIH